DREALVELARLYEGERLFADQLEMLDALAEGAEPKERITIELKAAAVVETQLSDLESAIGRYRKLLSSGDNAPEQARVALERIVRDETMREVAAQVLEPFYQERGEIA